MLYFRMRDCSVVRFIPKRAAAPSGPPTWPFASSSAFRILACLALGDAAGDFTCGGPGTAVPISPAMGHLTHAAAGQDDRPLQHVLQFADVAGPIVVRQRVQNRRRNGIDVTAHAMGVLLYEVAREQRHVFAAVSQWRNMHREDMQPIVKLGPESVVLHHGLQIPVRSSHQPGVRADRAAAANAFEFLVLDRAQQLRLEFERHFADFVEKERASMRQFKSSDLLRHRSGERALFVSE